MIIGINGYASSGKDTVGNIIQYLTAGDTNTSIEDVLKQPASHQWWLEDVSGWEIKKWAGKLKFIASVLTGIDEEKFEDQEFKKTNLSHHWSTLKHKAGTRQDGIFPKNINMEIVPMTVREFLQRLGTDALRDGLHTNTWVNALMADYKHDNYANAGALDDAQAEDLDYNGYPNWIITDTRFPNEAQAIKDAGGLMLRIDRTGVKPINDHPSEIGLDNYPFDYRIANVSDIPALVQTIETILKKENIF